MKSFAASYAEGGDGVKKTQIAVLILLLFVLLKSILPPNAEQAEKLLAFFGAGEETIQALGRSLDGRSGTQSVFKQVP